MIKNKVAVVTGASSGIGLETARLLAESGAKVYAVARRQDLLEKLESEQSNVTAVTLDVCDDLTPLLDAVGSEPVSILVNNAGLAWGLEPIQSASAEKWNTMIDTNVKALISVTQALMPKLIENPNASIVNMGSIAAHEFYGNGGAYCASKAAVKALTKAWRQDLLGKDVRVIGIHPGMVETEFSKVRFDGDESKAKDVYNGMTPLSGKDIAEAIVWTLSCPRHMCIESMVIMPTEQANCWSIHRD